MFSPRPDNTDMSYYRDTRTYRQDTRECDDDDVGSKQVSCKYIEVGKIDGYLSKGYNRDLRWPKLKKYWGSLDNLLKFGGTACARNSNEAEAVRTAKTRAKRLVTQLTKDFDEENLTGLLGSLGYLKHDGGFKCISTPNTRGKEPETAQVKRKSGPEISRLVFHVKNNTRKEIGIHFKTSPRNRTWPSSNHHWKVSDGESRDFSLPCYKGEKVCWGAWDDTGTWAIGKGKGGCKGCCYMCGGGDAYATLIDSSEQPEEPPVVAQPEYIPPEPSYEEPPPERSTDNATYSGGGSARSCEEVTPGAKRGPRVPAGTYNPAFDLPYSDACYVRWLGGTRGAAGRQEDEAKCYALQGVEILEWSPDGGSNYNMCVFRITG
jgi:hypothetical protein